MARGLVRNFVFALAVTGTVAAGCGTASAPAASQPSAPPTVGSILPSQPPTSIPSASSSGAAAPTVPVGWTTYISNRYAYSIDYPSDWTPTEARQDWSAAGDSYPDDAAIDKWAPPTNDPTWILMFVSSVPLLKDEKPAERIARLDRDNAGQCTLGHRRLATVDGVTAREEDGSCFGSDFIDEIAVTKNGRFYFLYVLSGGPLTDVTLATFHHFVQSFRFLKP